MNKPLVLLKPMIIFPLSSGSQCVSFFCASEAHGLTEHYKAKEIYTMPASLCCVCHLHHTKEHIALQRSLQRSWLQIKTNK